MNLFLPSDPRPLHFVGIAGAGMSALALLALRRGVPVTGTDRAAEGAADLVRAGATVLQGHDPSSVVGARGVVVSAAVARDHPEVLRALAEGIPVVPRKVALAELVAGATVVAIAGTHGKTTTTAMTTEALVGAGFDPTGLAGGRVSAWEGNARLGGNALYVVEADEYDQAFLELPASVAVVTNVEPEHLECYGGDPNQLFQAFSTFAGRAERVLIGPDPGAEKVAGTLRQSAVWRYGSGAPDLRVDTVLATAEGTVAGLRLPGGDQVTLRLVVPGMHNVWNATAAIGVVQHLGGSVTGAASALARFPGVGRRFERKGDARGITVVDDYAHHATEVGVTLAAARQAFPGRRIVAIFQPHLYSRTQAQGQEMGRALARADRALVTEIYPAREAPIPGVSGASVVEALTSAGGSGRFVPDRALLLAEVLGELRTGDVVLTLGAGDITALGPHLLDALAVG